MIIIFPFSLDLGKSRGISLGCPPSMFYHPVINSRVRSVFQQVLIEGIGTEDGVVMWIKKPDPATEMWSQRACHCDVC